MEQSGVICEYCGEVQTIPILNEVVERPKELAG